MIVTYSGANIMYLPMQHYIQSGNNAGKLQDSKTIDQTRIQRFNPGKNEISPEDWKLVQGGIAARDKLRPGVQSHYDECLSVIGGEEQEDGLVIGPDSIDFLALHWKEAVKLVNGTVVMSELEGYKSLEQGNTQPRPAVLKAIAAQVVKVEAFHTKVADGKKE